MHRTLQSSHNLHTSIASSVFNILVVLALHLLLLLLVHQHIFLNNRAGAPFVMLHLVSGITPSSFREPHSGIISSISNSPIPSPITSSSFVSPLCSSITPSLFHCRLKPNLFYKSFPIVSLLPPDCFHGLSPGPFLLSYLVFIFIFSLFLFLVLFYV